MGATLLCLIGERDNPQWSQAFSNFIMDVNCVDAPDWGTWLLALVDEWGGTWDAAAGTITFSPEEARLLFLLRYS